MPAFHRHSSARSPARSRLVRALQHALVALVATCALTTACKADINADMASFFNQMGALSTSTPAGAYQAQGMNVYMGGELQVRMPVRTYQMYSYAMPSVRAGCGGIDAFMGSFSHINSQQFREMLEQVGNATVGLLFKAALAAINPLIESKLAELGMDIKMEGIFSRNSCQMAQSLVNGLSGMTGMSSDSSCISMAKAMYGDDDAAARRRCGPDKVGVNNAGLAASDPELQALAKRDINLLWHALRDSGFTTAEKETLLNIAGSMIVYSAPGSGARTPTHLESTIDSLAVFMNGHEPGSEPGTVRIRGYWTCPTPDCLAPVREGVDIVPFSEMVRQRLLTIASKMATGDRLDAMDIAMINHTSIPVHRMLRLGYQAGPSTGLDVQQMFIARFSQVIALDYAHTFMVQALKNVQVYMGSVEYIGPQEEAKAKDMRDRLWRMIDSLDRERVDALRRVGDIDKLVAHLERTERAMRQSLGGPSRTMLDFGGLMAGKGRS